MLSKSKEATVLSVGMHRTGSHPTCQMLLSCNKAQLLYCSEVSGHPHSPQGRRYRSQKSRASPALPDSALDTASESSLI